jgi:hypothetical protein
MPPSRRPADRPLPYLRANGLRCPRRHNILAGRMRACGKHELIEEAAMFEAEAIAAYKAI